MARPLFVSLLATLVASGCAAPSNHAERFSTEDKAEDAPSFVSPDDEDVVLIEHLTLPRNPSQVTEFEERVCQGKPCRMRERTPFSHRSQKWHMYHFTAYGPSVWTAAAVVDDAEMFGTTTFWVFGPRTDSGWGEPFEVRTIPEEPNDRLDLQHGRAVLDIREAGDYAIVIGPSTREDFRYRFPGRAVTLTDTDTGDHDYEGEVTRSWDGKWRLSTVNEHGATEQYEVVEPFPFTGDNELLHARNDAGTVVSFVPNDWQRESFFLRTDDDDDDAAEERLYLGFLRGDYYGSSYAEIHPLATEGATVIEQFIDYHIIDSVGPDGREFEPQGEDADDGPRMRPQDAAYVTVVPVVDPRTGEEIDVHCASGDMPECLVPVRAEDGVLLVDPPTETYRQTYLDFDEESTYAFGVTCSFGCFPENDGPTNNPIYLAHGFNSDAETWSEVIEKLIADDDRWQGWLHAADVPGYEPIAPRAEQLRCNLAAFLEDLASRDVQPAEGDDFQRLNIVAHSMGGLDSRYLTGAEKYNHDDCGEVAAGELACSNTDGAPEACCPGGVPWSERIASITTLSTPHHGSTFADWGRRKLSGGFIGWLFRKVISKIMGLDTERDREDMINTLGALSEDFARNTMLPAFSTPAAADRQYEWDCALLGDDCQPMLEDWSQNGRLVPTSWEEIGAEDLPRHQSWPYAALLPAPTDQATVFSWSATACTRGECGSYLSSSLLLSNRIINKDSFARSVGNDGVVTQVSAEFGIHMGNWSWDHLHWTRSKSGLLSRFKRWLTGQEQEPVENFYFYWLEWLHRSGY